jgi:hypothetical protein
VHLYEELVETIEMDISFAIFGAPKKKSSMGMTWKTLEDPRTIIITRPGTKPTRFHNFVKLSFSRDLSRSWEMKKSTPRHDSLCERIIKWH